MRRTLSGAAVVLLAVTLTACRGAEPSADGGKADVGVTSEPCPQAVDANKGCIYLGMLSALTGPLAPLGAPAVEASQAFWKKVNADGGIAGRFEVDAVTYVKDHKYNPQTASEVYQEIKSKVLALGISVGSPTTAAILPDLKTNNILAVAGGYSSGLLFEDVLVESGPSYCVEAMNNVDHAGDALKARSVMIVHFPGDYGDDAAGGAKYAAGKRGLAFSAVGTGQGQDKQAGAVAAVLKAKPDVVLLATGPAEAAAIVGGAVAQGFRGKFIGLGPTWTAQLNQSPAAPALKAAYLESQGLAPYDSDTPGHVAMRAALGSPKSPSEAYVAGWAGAYPLKAALNKAATAGDLTRANLVTVLRSLAEVDYQGMLPTGAGNFAAGPAGQVKQSFVNQPDPARPTGLSAVSTLDGGVTAAGFTPDKPCYEM